MPPKADDGMIAQLLSAGRNALGAHFEGKTGEEQETLEFMDSLWDRMPPEARNRALQKLCAEGLDGFARKIEEERKYLEGDRA